MRTDTGASPDSADPPPHGDVGAAAASTTTAEAGGPKAADTDGTAAGGESTGTARDDRPAWRRLIDGWPAQAAAVALLLSLLSHLRYAYAAGANDHLVLSALGIRWADPDAFVNDWTLANAPQPHWLFDVVTWIGASTGTLSAVYLLYWLAGFVVFGVATTLLARTWTPHATWIAVISVTVIASLAPLNLLGSGVHLYSVALPNGLGGALLYLCAAAILVGRHRLAAAAGVATALAHVQHGVVALVLLLMTAVAVWLLRRGLDRYLLGGTVATIAIVAFNLTLRPVAGELKDFQEVCGLLIPFHCEATSWKWNDFYGGVAFVALGLLTVMLLPRAERFRWVIVVGLPAVGLIAAVFTDRLDVPVLGLATQGLNVYRLAVLLFQFAVWGLLVVVLGRLTPRQRWAGLAITLVLGWYAVQSSYWALDGKPAPFGPLNRVGSIPLMLIVGLCLVAAVAVQTVPGLVRRGELATRAALGAGLAVLLFSAVAGNHLRLTTFNPRFFPHDGLVAWGERVQDAVPPGEQLLVPPGEIQVRMATRRAVVVDCKLAPYGGEAWYEYRRRIEALGGFPECGAWGWRTATADQLAAAAGRYGAGYLVVRSDWPNDIEIATTLTGRGWTQVIGEQPGAPFRVLRAPWESG
jgi:hypothetical protein